MRCLLDTHALLWWQLDTQRLPAAVRRLIEDAENLIYFSPVNAFEIANKWRLGKLSLSPRFLDDFGASMAKARLLELPLTTDHALAAARLTIDHRDPFDRMLIAQALCEDMALLSNEQVFDAAGVRRMWD